MKRKRDNPLRRPAISAQLGATLTPEQLGARWDVAVGTLKNWRREGKGPKFVALTDTPRPPIVYLVADVEAFEQQRKSA